MGGSIMTTHKSLKTLSTLAIALLGTKEVCAETRIISPKVSLNYGRSDENKNKYKYDLFNLDYATPIGDSFDLALNAGRDVMAGASSIFYEPEIAATPTGSPTKLYESTSGASKITDQRLFLSGTGRFFGKESSILGKEYNFGLTLGASKENDFISHTVGVSHSRSFNNNNTEVGLGITVNNSKIRKRKYSNIQLSVFNLPTKYRNSQEYVLTLRQDLTNQSYITGTISYRYDQGYLDDPYKAVFFYGDASGLSKYYAYIPNIALGGRLPGGYTLTGENRPSHRNDGAAYVKYVHYLKCFDSAIHVDYRYMQSDWKIRSHTFSTMYVQPFAEKWEIAPSVRYYTQKEAYFYSPLFQVNNLNTMPAKKPAHGKYFASDYRLSQFGSIDTTIRLSRTFLDKDRAKVTLMGGILTRRNSLYWGSKPKVKNPTNNFNNYYGMITLTFNL